MILSNTAPVVFIQYLMAIAIVEGIHSYDRGYEKVPVKLKWPNDICKFNTSATPFCGETSDM
jgi:biotin--protein ligase